MLCANCLLEIDDDSTYCDQCGNKIMICPECGYAGSYSVCPNDGTKLILNNDKKNYQSRNFFKTERTKSKEKISRSPIITLSNRTLNLKIEISSNDILGRATDKFAKVFSNLKQISSKHVSFLCRGNSWLITDLGSTNGTKLNGKLLFPMQPEKIKEGDSLILANIEFYVS